MHEIVCGIEDNEQVQKKLDPCKDVELHRGPSKKRASFDIHYYRFLMNLEERAWGNMSGVERCNKIECMMIAETTRISTTRHVQKFVYADCSHSCYAGSTLNHIVFDKYCKLSTKLLQSDH
jgi:hypothetical protein